MRRLTESTQQYRQRGFTMTELMVVVSMVGILAAIALPAFQPLIERWRNRTASEELKNSLYFARSKAIQLGGNLVIERREIGPKCVSTGNDDWSCGWRIYFDGNRDGNQGACTNADDTECTIQESNVPPTTLLAVAPNDGGRLFMDRSGRITDKSGAILNKVSFDIIAKGKTLSTLGSSRLCITGPGKFKQVNGSESC